MKAIFETAMCQIAEGARKSKVQRWKKFIPKRRKDSVAAADKLVPFVASRPNVSNLRANPSCDVCHLPLY